MTEPIRGIHHITAIAGDPQRNLDFYTKILGLRMVKKTVNFDDPGTYHFYFGDQHGSPGTILTFFPWTNVRHGRHGTGQVTTVTFSVPPGSLPSWQERLQRQGVTVSVPLQRLGENILPLLDPDGLPLELIEVPGVEDVAAWQQGPVAVGEAIRCFHAPALMVPEDGPTLSLMRDIFGFEVIHEQPEGTGGARRIRLAARDAGAAFTPGAVVDLLCRPAEEAGRMGGGVVHHIAWRAPNDEQQLQWREALLAQGFDVTPVLDRQYFHSIYFREPAGILFEIATDPPGFTLDESPEALGSALKLPPWLEESRNQIEQVLPKLT